MITRSFARVDAAPNPGDLVAYLDRIRSVPALRAFSEHALRLLGAREGESLLDVGCGTGEDALALAEIAGPGGRVVAVDSSKTMLAVARRRPRESGSPIEFQAGDAHHLPFPDHTFDRVMANRLLQHVPQPLTVLREMVRVARPEGTILVIDCDWQSLTVNASDPQVTRRILDLRCDQFESGSIGRALPELFRECGLPHIDVFPTVGCFADYGLANELLRLEEFANLASDVGVVSEAEAADWIRYLRQAGEQGRFFAATMVFVVRGRIPAANGGRGHFDPTIAPDCACVISPATILRDVASDHRRNDAARGR
jgi:ubiquinone/menaquinone biosynthesis C-methylase UbiE